MARRTLDGLGCAGLGSSTDWFCWPVVLVHWQASQKIVRLGVKILFRTSCPPLALNWKTANASSSLLTRSSALTLADVNTTRNRRSGARITSGIATVSFIRARFADWN